MKKVIMEVINLEKPCACTIEVPVKKRKKCTLLYDKLPFCLDSCRLKKV